jgi:hypothetical protein
VLFRSMISTTVVVFPDLEDPYTAIIFIYLALNVKS